MLHDLQKLMYEDLLTPFSISSFLYSPHHVSQFFQRMNVVHTPAIQCFMRLQKADFRHQKVVSLNLLASQPMSWHIVYELAPYFFGLLANDF